MRHHAAATDDVRPRRFRLFPWLDALWHLRLNAIDQVQKDIDERIAGMDAEIDSYRRVIERREESDDEDP